MTNTAPDDPFTGCMYALALSAAIIAVMVAAGWAVRNLL